VPPADGGCIHLALPTLPGRAPASRTEASPVREIGRAARAENVGGHRLAYIWGQSWPLPMGCPRPIGSIPPGQIIQRWLGRHHVLAVPDGHEPVVQLGDVEGDCRRE